MTDVTEQPAHWLLAEMGKRVLRPGGKELTLELLDALDAGPADDVVEFAPGVGFTAERVLERTPQSYTAIELDRDAAADLERRFDGPNREIVVGNAANTELDDGVADVVYGEAMLTMHPDDGKASIVEEAHRLLRSGGRYGVHELALEPNDLDDETKATIRRDLAAATKVNARPQTSSEWISLLEDAGFDVVWKATAPMHLLRPRRVLDDEGLVGAVRFGVNVLTHPGARRRVRDLRRAFTAHERHMNAIALIAEKP
ncbi:class I SAM-dependent methyltransferase [Halopiger goleimassiliensis]|uniref:class I SAM-dependent methyltransferase n=1 Tax=Halopiger goleimassiliensis TaxID=1293048 RepID=UPI000677663F|nr:class I SAM-dependent methyltransferase [Halopiger goleimassiliensis]